MLAYAIHTRESRVIVASRMWPLKDRSYRVYSNRRVANLDGSILAATCGEDPIVEAMLLRFLSNGVNAPEDSPRLGIKDKPQTGNQAAVPEHGFVSALVEYALRRLVDEMRGNPLLKMGDNFRIPAMLISTPCGLFEVDEEGLVLESVYRFAAIGPLAPTAMSIMQYAHMQSVNMTFRAALDVMGAVASSHLGVSPLHTDYETVSIGEI